MATFNVMLILGVAASVAPISVALHPVRLAVPVLLAVSLVVLLLGLKLFGPDSVLSLRVLPPTPA